MGLGASTADLPLTCFIWVTLWKALNILKKISFLIVCIYVSMCGYVHMSIGVQRPEVTNPFGAGVIGLLWVLGTELGSFAREKKKQTFLTVVSPASTTAF